jgi:hypothetical protein
MRLHDIWCTMLALTCTLVLSACAAPPPPSSAYTVYAHLVGKPEITIDPATGDRIRTTNWEFDDGYKTTSVERIQVGGDNEFRRNLPEPRPRVVVD